MGIPGLDEESDYIYDQTIVPEKDIPETPSEVINKVLPDKNKYETIEIVNRDKQLDKIVQYIEGKKWEVSYYLQLITKDNEIGRFDYNSPDVSKQYMLLNNMVLYVQDSLSQNSSNELVGSAIVNANITPNAGDVFVATLMGNRRGLISITSVESKDYNLNTVWHIEFKLDIFLDTNDVIIDKLNEMVVKTYYYDDDFLMTNSEPILLEEDFKNKRKITISIKEIIEYYFKTMYNSEKSVLAIPGQNEVVIDIMYQEFIFKLVNANDSEYITKITRNTIPNDAFLQPTILDAILLRNSDIVNSCNRKSKVLSIGNFSNSNIHLRNIGYMGIRYVIYPDTPDISIMETPDKSSLNSINLNPSPNPYRDNKGVVENLLPVLDTTNEFYIFTEHFYKDNRENMSIFEIAVRAYLDGETIDNETLASLIDDYQYWDRVQQFYFIPILVVLLKDATNKTRSS